MRAHRARWVMAAALVGVIGVAGSVLGAHAVAGSATQRSGQVATTSSLEVAANLTLSIQREQDLAVSAGTFLSANPDVTTAQFQEWVATGRIFTRFPEILGIAQVVLVPSAGLGAFATRAQADPAGTLGPEGTFEVSPPGSRPFYCFDSVAQSRTGRILTPAGLDLCATQLGPALLAARDTGRGAYVPYGTGSSTQLVVGTPIYSGGTIPTTVQARRDAFLGWTGTQIDPAQILNVPLDSHPDAAVVFRYHQGATEATIRAGHAPSGARSTTIDLHNGWQVEVLTAPIHDGVIDNPMALAILVGGIALSLLLAVLIYVLGTSRSRALHLVDERTDQLRHQALHDALTGLPNRALILDRLGQMLAQSRRRPMPLAVLFIDLDDFKDINDTMGHGAGDELLITVAGRLQVAIREGDTVGRLGGDEFVVLTGAASPEVDAAMVAERILGVLARPVVLTASDVPVTVSASIGYAEGYRDTPDELLQDADIALYEAKARGKRCAVRFVPSMQEAVDHHRHVEVDLHRALEDDEFFLVYQPTFDLATGDFTGVEALLRWQHPEYGVAQPDEFLPVLESSGLIVAVGAWVLHEACRQGAAWARAGHPFVMSVNVSARQLHRDRLIDDVEDALSMSGLEPGRLILELTETALMHDAETTVARLQALKSLGVRIAVDDFGTGYSSLAYLKQFPIDVLKIDRSFVAGITESAESIALVHTLVQLGKVLGIETMAEGVESSDQASLLRTEEVDSGQGFHFARPMGVDALGDLLRSGGWPDVLLHPGLPDDGPGRPVGTATS
ncbi:MAG TPA: EAL domain-containing protein [Acidimicrobiales bacterium]